jgi:hypothetical protein
MSAKLPRIKCLDVAILPLPKLFICRGDRQTFAHAAVAIHTAAVVANSADRPTRRAATINHPELRRPIRIRAAI